MSLTLADTYLLKALDHYPFNLELAVEAVGYAYGYDEEHAGVHWLYGRIYAEQLKLYPEACHHYEMAIFYNKEFPAPYAPYARLLIHLENYDEAVDIIDKGMLITGVDKSSMWYNRAIAHELNAEYNKAFKCFEASRTTHYL